jgi:hypothetical protein
VSRKHNKTGRSKSESRYVRLDYYLLDTPAWSSLDATCRALYVEIKRRHNGFNNGKIPYSVREGAKAFHLGVGTISRKLNILQERGFLIAEQKGAFDWKVRHSTRWRLTETIVEETGELATKEFARWQPGVSFTVSVVEPIPAPKKQKPVSVVEPVGICGGTLGICGGTEDPEIAAHGICGGTVEAQNGGASVSVVEQSIDNQVDAAFDAASSQPAIARAQRADIERRSKPARLSSIPSSRSASPESSPKTSLQALNAKLARKTGKALQ